MTTEALANANPSALPLPPGPKGHLILGSLPDRLADPIGFFTGLARDYGPVSYARLATRHLALISDPELTRQVLFETNTRYTKGFAYSKLQPLLGNGLLTSEGEFWRRQRKLAQPAFHRQRLAKLADVMVEEIDARIASWKPGSIIDLGPEMTALALSVVARTLLGSDVTKDVADVNWALPLLLKDADRQILNPIPLTELLPTPYRLRVKRGRKLLFSIVDRVIAEHRAKASPDWDLLTMLMEMQDEQTGERMSDSQLRDEVMTMFLAGHETTANCLAWTFYLLSSNPDVAAKLQAEVDALGGRKPGFDDLPKLAYAQKVAEESLRLYPPAWAVTRESSDDVALGGYRVPKGTILILSAYILHHDDKSWPNPEGFDPDRARPANKFAFLPFGGGPRQCIGNHFAMMELQLTLARVLQACRLDLVAGQQIVPEASITLKPKNGVRMRVVRRA